MALWWHSQPYHTRILIKSDASARASDNSNWDNLHSCIAYSFLKELPSQWKKREREVARETLWKYFSGLKNALQEGKILLMVLTVLWKPTFLSHQVEGIKMLASLYFWAVTCHSLSQWELQHRTVFPPIWVAIKETRWMQELLKSLSLWWGSLSPYSPLLPFILTTTTLWG